MKISDEIKKSKKIQSDDEVKTLNLEIIDVKENLKKIKKNDDTSVQLQT